MYFLVCLAGLPQEVVSRVQTGSSFNITGGLNNPPIARALRTPGYQPDMAAYYHRELARRIEALDPREDVSVVVVYINYPDSAPGFIQQFFPFALTSSLNRVPLEGLSSEGRKVAVARLIKEVIVAATDLRERVAHLREVVSGQKLSPFTLPMRNFDSKIFVLVLRDVFRELGSADKPHTVLQEGRSRIEAEHPVARVRGQMAHFKDGSRFCFHTPGSDLHGINRGRSKDHNDLCTINSRSRLGSPLRAGFHYDCNYGDRRRLNPTSTYPNCHEVKVSVERTTHVNISPNDAIR